MRLRDLISSVDYIRFNPVGGDHMTAAAFLAVWAGLDQTHGAGPPPVSSLPEQRMWTDGRWRAVLTRGYELEVPRHRKPLAARRHGILHIAR